MYHVEMDECTEVRFFQKRKANAGLYRMGFIFGLDWCQRGYFVALSARPIGICSGCSPPAGIFLDHSSEAADIWTGDREETR